MIVYDYGFTTIVSATDDRKWSLLADYRNTVDCWARNSRGLSKIFVVSNFTCLPTSNVLLIGSWKLIRCRPKFLVHCRNFHSDHRIRNDRLFKTWPGRTYISLVYVENVPETMAGPCIICVPAVASNFHPAVCVATIRGLDWLYIQSSHSPAVSISGRLCGWMGRERIAPISQIGF